MMALSWPAGLGQCLGRTDGRKLGNQSTMLGTRKLAMSHLTALRLLRRLIRRGWGIDILAMTIAFFGFLHRASAAELDSVRSIPLGDLTLHVMPQSHIDLAWWWRYDPETLQIVAEHTLETAFANFEQFPDYTFTFLQVPSIEPLERLNPRLFYRLRYYAHRPEPMRDRLPNPEASGAAGRLAIGSGLWCEVDASVPCGESLVRQCLYGKRYFRLVFGIDVRTAWFQDAWTHPWTYPQILQKSGMDSYMFSRPRGQGESMFWWESPDGSRVFAYKPMTVDGESLPPQEAVNQRLRITAGRYGVKDDLTLIGVGNHGGGAIRADVERMRTLMAQRQTNAEPPRIKFSTPARFVDAVLRESHSFPVIRTELRATIRGAYTSVGEIKQGNRQSENLLLTAEKFCSIAARLGVRSYPQGLLFEAWKKVMLNQFHDTISGTEIQPAVDDALQRYREVQDTVGVELQAALKAMAARIHTKGPGVPLIVFNPLVWERTEIAECELEFEEPASAVALTDDDGQPVISQILSRKSVAGHERIRFAFTAKALSSLGYRTYWARPVKLAEKSEAVPSPGPYQLENGFFKIRIDPGTGCLESIYDKVHEREVQAGKSQGNLIQVLEDFGDSEGFLRSAQGELEHNVWDGRSWDVVSDPQIIWAERGPVRQAVQVKKKFGLARFTQRIALPQDVPRIEFELAIAWQGTNRMVKVAFPLSISSPVATCEIPYGAIARRSNGEECVAQNWVDISAGGYGVSLLNDSRYGHDFAPNIIRLSVLRSPDHPVAATEQRGLHRIRYALYPHAGNWQEAGLPRRGQEWNNPPITVVETPHSGDLPSRYSFLEATPGNIIVSVLKKAEDSDDLLLRCYESTGSSCSARITLADPLKIDAVHTTDLLEQSQAEDPCQSTNFETPIGAWSIETYKLIRDPE